MEAKVQDVSLATSVDKKIATKEGPRSRRFLGGRIRNLTKEATSKLGDGSRGQTVGVGVWWGRPHAPVSSRPSSRKRGTSTPRNMAWLSSPQSGVCCLDLISASGPAPTPQAASIGGHGDDSERLPIQSWNVGWTGGFPLRGKTRHSLWVTRPLFASRSIPQAVTETMVPGLGPLNEQADMGTETCKRAGPEPFSHPSKLAGPQILFLGCLRANSPRIQTSSR